MTHSGPHRHRYASVAGSSGFSQLGKKLPHVPQTRRGFIRPRESATTAPAAAREAARQARR
jgi:hypothetical protein